MSHSLFAGEIETDEKSHLMKNFIENERNEEQRWNVEIQNGIVEILNYKHVEKILEW